MANNKLYRWNLIALSFCIPLFTLWINSKALALPIQEQREGNSWYESYFNQSPDARLLLHNINQSNRINEDNEFSLNSWNHGPRKQLNKNSSPNKDSIKLDAPTTVIDIWYGDSQSFGQQGIPQRWVNILGNVSDSDHGVSSLIYSLNSGPQANLSIGPDQRRLLNPGDFNIEIDKDDLQDGENAIVITATNGIGLQETISTSIDFQSGNIWSLPYFIDWSTVTNAQDVLQIIDGLWTWDSSGIHTVDVGYDRVLAIGDMGWEDYEVTVPITIHSIDESAYGTLSVNPGVGIMMRWQGHTNTPIYCPQPHCGWQPFGSSNWYDWLQNQPDTLKITAEPPGGNTSTNNLQFQLGHTYWFKARAETNPSGTLYRFKVWEDSIETEPESWIVERQANTENLSNGSFLLIAHHVDATFGNLSVLPIPFSNTLQVNTIGNGNVVVDPDQNEYNYGQSVTLTATAGLGSSFLGWSGDLTSMENPATIIMTSDRVITATFTQNDYFLNIIQDGQGSVTKSPDRVTYHYGDVVTLQALPDPGWSFSAWSGDQTGSTNPVDITIIGDINITTTFSQDEYTLDISTVGQGSVSRSPDQPTYHYGDIVTLQANPDPGWSFSSWSGDQTGSTNPVDITITGDTNITATFSQDDYTLNISTVGQGFVSKSPDQPTYHYGDIVALQAFPNTGWSFSAWSGDQTGSTNPVDITITGNTNITATFSQDRYSLNVTIIGSGSVSKLPLKSYYHYGDFVTLEAIPHPGWSFSGWDERLNYSQNIQNKQLIIIITSNKNIVATFVRDEIKIYLPLITK